MLKTNLRNFTSLLILFGAFSGSWAVKGESGIRLEAEISNGEVLLKWNVNDSRVISYFGVEAQKGSGAFETTTYEVTCGGSCVNENFEITLTDSYYGRGTFRVRAFYTDGTSAVSNQVRPWDDQAPEVVFAPIRDEDVLRITGGNEFAGSFATVEILSIEGKVFHNETKPPGNFEMNLSVPALSSGIYVIMLTYDDKAEVKKIIW